MNNNLDRGLLYGDGFFTTIKVSDNKIHRWPLHLERISFSAERLKFHQLDANELYQLVMGFIAQQSESEGALRLTISRGANAQDERGYKIPTNPQYQFNCHWTPIDFSNMQTFSQGVSLSICETPISQNKVLSGIKHLNRLDQVLASDEIEKDCFDGLMLANKFIISGTKSNVYFYLNDRWLTPKLKKSGVNGTVRRWLLESQANVSESKFGLEIFKRAEYCLVSNAIVGIIPVTEIKGVGANKRFPIYPKLTQLQSAYNQV